MAVTLRARKTAYDNIAVGSATGTERTLAGAAPPSQAFGNGENIQVGVDYGADENIVVVATNMLAGERLG
jgi:hypothetical protein